MKYLSAALTLALLFTLLSCDRSTVPSKTLTDTAGFENVTESISEYTAPTEFSVLSNDGNVKISVVTVPLTSKNTEILSFPFNDRYTLYTTYDKEYDGSGNFIRDCNVMLYVLDGLSGEIAYAAEIDTSFHITTLSSEGENICKMYSESDNDGKFYNTYTLALSDTFKLIKGTQSVTAPIFSDLCISADGEYTAFAESDGTEYDGGIVILHNGIFTRVLENTAYKDRIDINDVKRYIPIGFIDNTILAYKLTAWEGSGGYGFYDAATGENLEIRNGNYYPIMADNGCIFAKKGGYYDDEGSFDAIVKLAPMLLDETVAASHGGEFGGYSLPNGAGCTLTDELWFVSHRDADERGIYHYNYITVFSPYFENELARIVVPDGAWNRINIYGTSVTYVKFVYSSD